MFFFPSLRLQIIRWRSAGVNIWRPNWTTSRSGSATSTAGTELNRSEDLQPVGDATEGTKSDLPPFLFLFFWGGNVSRLFCHRQTVEDGATPTFIQLDQGFFAAWADVKRCTGCFLRHKNQIFCSVFLRPLCVMSISSYRYHWMYLFCLKWSEIIE